VADSIKSDDTQTAAAAFGLALIKAYMSSNSDQAFMYKLYRIYLDKDAQGDRPLSATQKAAYERLTPECNKAFDGIAEAYNKGRTAVDGANAGRKNATCTSFDNKDNTADLALCVFAPSVITADNGQKYANLSATFTNYGVQVCNVTFFVRNIEKASSRFPAWLPVADRGYPNGIPQYTEINLRATVEYVNDFADASKPVFDLFPGWFACPNGRPQQQDQATTTTPRPTEKPVAKPGTGGSSGAGVLGTQPMCFQTPKCTAAVDNVPTSGTCPQFKVLMSSGCHTCSADTLENSRQQCLALCSPSDCVVPSGFKNGDKSSTSPAAPGVKASLVMLSTLASIVAAILLL
jgi:hypothetical protein